MSDQRVCFISSNTFSDYLYLVIINDYLIEKIKIRYYTINLNLYSLEFLYKLSLTLYNNFICLSTS